MKKEYTMEPEYQNTFYAVPQTTFTASKKEKLFALLSYPAAYFYVRFFLLESLGPIALAIFALVFAAGALLFHWQRKGGWETWVWLGCLGFCVLCPLFGLGRAWEGLEIFAAHCFAIYLVLCCANVLLEGRTGHLLPLDGLYGVIIYPFGNFFLRIRVLIAAIRSFPRHGRRQYLWSIPAVLIAVGLFAWIASLLSRSDSIFANLTEKLLAYWPDFDITEDLIYFLLSLPVGAYLYGLVVGTGRKSPEAARGKGVLCSLALEKLRKVPNTVWVLLLAAFAVLYGVFFAVQGSYLFGAFTRTLPENFTVAEYARQGFFELIKVMALNFLLLWIALRSAGKSGRAHLPLKLMATILLSEGLLFAVVAASKLGLYIDCFGFTPLRLQSAWLICVLFSGTCAALYALWTGRRTVRAWAMFSGISFALLCLY